MTGPASARWPLACFVAEGLFWGTWAALLPDIRAQVGASDAELGLALVGAGIGALPAMVITGRLWARMGWSLLPLTAFGFALAALGPLFAPTPIALALAMVFVGAFSGALDVAMNAAVSDVEAATRRRLMFAAHALFSLAVLIGSVTTGLLRETGGGSDTALPVVAAMLAVVAAGTVSSAVRGRASRADDTGTPDAGPGLRTSLLITFAALCAGAFLIEDAVASWSALHLERELAAGPAIGGAAPGIFAGAMFLGRSAGQWLGARFTDRALLAGGALTTAIGLGLAAVAGTQIVALTGFALAGAGVSLVAPALFARAGRMAGARGRGSAIALLTVFGYLGFVIGPVLMGLVSEAAGLRVALAMLGGLALILAPAGLLIFNARRAGTFAEGEELLKTSRG